MIAPAQPNTIHIISKACQIDCPPPPDNLILLVIIIGAAALGLGLFVGWIISR